MDRGDESKELLDFFYDLYKLNRFIYVRGNHEDLFLEMIRRGAGMSHDLSNGTVKTLGNLCDPKWSEETTLWLFDEAAEKYDKRFLELIKNSVNYYEIGNYIFVHGWIPFNEFIFGKYEYDPNWRNASNALWADARWANGMLAASQGVIEPNKTIVCGHWHTSWANVRKLDNIPFKDFTKVSARKYREKEFDENADVKTLFGIFREKGIIALDACTAHSLFCNCLHLTEEELYKETV